MGLNYAVVLLLRVFFFASERRLTGGEKIPANVSEFRQTFPSRSRLSKLNGEKKKLSRQRINYRIKLK
jgi:hypothetical protein